MLAEIINDTYYKIALIFFAIMIVVALFFVLTKRVIQNKLLNSLMNGDYEQFDALVNKDITRLSIRPYNLFFMELCAAIAKNNKAKVKEIANYFRKIKMNQNQKIALYSKLFYFYITQNDKSAAKRAYDELNEFDSYPNKNDIDCLKDTMLDEGYKYLDETLEKYAQASEDKKLQYEILLMNMYTNKNEIEKAKEYFEKSQSRMEKVLSK